MSRNAANLLDESICFEYPKSTGGSHRDGSLVQGLLLPRIRQTDLVRGRGHLDRPGNRVVPVVLDGAAQGSQARLLGGRREAPRPEVLQSQGKLGSRRTGGTPAHFFRKGDRFKNLSPLFFVFGSQPEHIDPLVEDDVDRNSRRGQAVQILLEPGSDGGRALHELHHAVIIPVPLQTQ